MQVEPRPDAVLTVRGAQLETEPEVPVHSYSDSYGNICRRLTLGAGRSRIRYEAEVDVDGGGG